MSVLSLEDQRMEEYSSDIDEEYDHDHDHEEEEESGWTSYLIDFEIMNQRERDMKKKMMMSSSSHDDQSGYSMVSDDDVTGSNGGGDVRKLPRKLKTIIKKKKNRGEKVSDFEDPLEDTATSPHSSPKVSTFMIDDQMNSLMLTKKKGRSDNYDHKTGSPLGKGDRWYFHDQDQEMRSAAAGNEGRGIDDEEITCDSH